MHSQPIKNLRLITNVLPIFYLKNIFSAICNTGLFVSERVFWNISFGPMPLPLSTEETEVHITETTALPPIYHIA